MIISIKSLLGFTGDLGTDIDWNLLIVFTAFSSFGIFVGIYISKFIQAERIKKFFGIFVLIIAVLIILKELSQ
jgi:uncharacterized membrane protein YfcA